MKAINQFFHIISKTYILGTIPADLLLHFFVGLFVAMILLARGMDRRYAYAVVATLGLFKEIYDLLFVYPAPWHEYFFDFLATVLPLLILSLVARARRPKKHRPDSDVIKY